MIDQKKTYDNPGVNRMSSSDMAEFYDPSYWQQFREEMEKTNPEVFRKVYEGEFKIPDLNIKPLPRDE